MKNATLKGSLLVALGAASYGMLATYVKMAYREGFTTAELTITQFGLGFAGLLILTLLSKRQPAAAVPVVSTKKNILKLIVAGTSMGLTSVCYYMAVKFIPVSVAIVLLMQTVWMGVVLEMLLRKRLPAASKLVAVLLVLAGTVLSANLLKTSADINHTGLMWGLMAALCYTATLNSANRVALHVAPLKRSLYMILGGLMVILLIFHAALGPHFSLRILLHWGPVIALFGTILPPLLFMKGMPLTGVGIGTIVAAIEIPVTVLMANLLLKEPVSLDQWIGITLILVAVIGMNTKREKGATAL